jgi:histidinol dehydrogenase
MPPERLALDGDPAALAARLRALVPAPATVSEAVAEIVARVAAEGDRAVGELTARFDLAPGVAPPPLRVPAAELAGALAALPGEVRAGLELAAANVAAVARAGVGEDREVALPQGQRVRLRELPVRRAGVYVPGGRAPYPSTVLMGAVTARAAGVAEVAVAAPPGRDGRPHPAILAACALAEVDEAYTVGGAQAVAALALGTATIPRVDVVVGPGNLYSQEAKRQLSDRVGIDGFQGPSDLLAVCDDPAAAGLVALDLLAQAEHGPGTVVVAASPDAAVLEAVAGELTGVEEAGAAAALVHVPDLDAALALAEAFAPEHLELVGPGAEALAPRVRSAGCLFVGASGGTAFGDYVAGSNHVLPTGGAARFASALSPRTFRRRMAEVRVGRAAAALAPAGAAIARAEGFELHARSMEARMGPEP